MTTNHVEDRYRKQFPNMEIRNGFYSVLNGLMTNYTTFLIANDQMNIVKSSIEGPRIGLCATNMTLAESNINASGHGCLADEGLGAGGQTGECAGSGGALGGKGGYGGLLEHV